MKLHYHHILRSLRVHLVAKAIEVTFGYPPSKKTLFHFRTCMLYKKGNLSFWQELILFIQLLFVRAVFFYHNLVENMLEKDSTTDKCQPALGFATFVWRYKQLHRKFEQNPKQVLNLPSVKSLWILFKQNSQHWKD